MFETIDNIRYRINVIHTQADGIYSDFFSSLQRSSYSHADTDGMHTYLIGGQTCDSTDKLFAFTTPEPLMIGDRLLFRNIGAYSYGLETSFNGFSAPNEIITNLKDLP